MFFAAFVIAALATFWGSSDSESDSSLESEDSAAFGVPLTGFAAGTSESESEESEDSSDEEAFFTAVATTAGLVSSESDEEESDEDDGDTCFVEGMVLDFEGVITAGLASFAATSDFFKAGFFEVTLEDFGGRTALAGTSSSSDEPSSSSSDEEDSWFGVATFPSLVTLGAGFSSSSESDEERDLGGAFTCTALGFSSSSSDELSLLSSEDDFWTGFD